MYDATVAAFPDVNAAILCAAVADFKPEEVSELKIKREGKDLTLHLQSTQDIAAAVGKMKHPDQILIGFALETNDEEENAEQKMHKKNLDFIVLNSTRNEGTTFRSDDNQITIISDAVKKTFPKKPKTEVARDIIDELEILWR